ncbi:MAG: hypothetical protein ABSD38_29015 [Syntrophorhabdales bacterium]|jgi:hypothetical protein
MEETKEGKIKSPGSLIHTQADDCENARVTVEEVPVGDLAFDNALPDYRDETSFPMPIAVKAKGDSRHYIVDGRALDAGEATVTCLVYHVDQLDDTELALRKFAVRIAPIGSTARYPEILRNVCLLEQKLPPSSTNSKAYTAGGDRKSEDFRDDPQQAFRARLSTYTGRSRKTISRYIADKERIDLPTLNRLCEDKVCTRDFFEDIRDNKETLTRMCCTSGKSEEEITQAVSAAVVEWFDGYKTTGTVKKILPEHEPAPGAAGQKEPKSQKSEGKNSRSAATAKEEKREKDDRKDAGGTANGTGQELRREPDIVESLKGAVNDFVKKLDGTTTIKDKIDLIDDTVLKLTGIRRKLSEINPEKELIEVAV